MVAPHIEALHLGWSLNRLSRCVQLREEHATDRKLRHRFLLSAGYAKKPCQELNSGCTVRLLVVIKGNMHPKIEIIYCSPIV